MSVKLVEVLRNDQTESIHRGDMVIADGHGNILYKFGDAHFSPFLRSASKPFQGIVFLEAGILEKYDLCMKEIAIMISSHSGEQEHINVLKGIMDKTGITEDMLECGESEPVNKEAAKSLCKLGQPVTKLHNNCSGKHLAFILAAMMKGLPVKGYTDLNHPLQNEIKRVISELSGTDIRRIICGIDGCGLPVYGIPLANMAVAYANLCNSEFMEGKYAKSQDYIMSAMTMFPEMVGGAGRLDTELMRLFGDRLVGKFGAEGMYCIGLSGRFAGIALKIEDGNSRAVGPVIVETLLQIDIIDKNEAEKLRTFWKPDILNTRGEKVGEIRSCFKIN
jgi:L-asparaginase II